MCALYDLMDSSSFSLFLSCLSLTHTHEDGYNLCFGLDEKVKSLFVGLCARFTRNTENG